MSNKRSFDEAALEGYDNNELLIPNAEDTVDDALLFENIHLSPPNPEPIEQTISQQVEIGEIPSATVVPEEISTTAIARPPVENRDGATTTALEAANSSRATSEATQGSEDATAQQTAQKPPKKKARKNHVPTLNRGKKDWRDAYLTNHHKRKDKMMAEWAEAKKKHEKAMEAKYRKGPVRPDEQFKKREPLTRAPTACDFCRLFKSRCNSDKDTECSNCVKTNSWCGETNASTEVTHYRGLSKDQEEKIQTLQEELEGLKRREQKYRNEIEELKKQLDDFPPLPTLPTPYGSWQTLGSTDYQRNYGGKGTAQVPVAGSLGPSQSNHQPSLSTVASGSSQTAPGYPQQNEVGPASLTNYSQFGRLQPDTLLHQDRAVNFYCEQVPQPLDGQMDGMPHGLPTLPYSVFNTPLSQGIPPMSSLASQYSAPLQTQQLHSNHMNYYASSPAQVIAQGAHQVKTDSSYVYENPLTEEVSSNLQQPAEDTELYKE
ncbi:hypothetical protein BDV38DRAFT_287160 [Aspergillus pseudotamarii]|uniref:Zn(2)-C6 fungal-type domain-containing protein n=1 Tax=Aspergillus pseudotamarii TaxID=132259 RepID=A0A5N6SH59_ASPPS|nr:uncharacterized protein BDV38DRAFT_287160 [Aspergillus pseudotamarii]KAE8133070.1 hypothetical protein BDV38DRAFT_287160 [Aspergillus pseudotamarii]